MNYKTVIDVTKIEPRLKHGTIFEAFDNTLPGEAILIHNDHDPKPLYYQMLGERGNCFEWSYVEKGPRIWEVAIKRNEAGARSETIGQMVAKNIKKAEVFKNYGIDYCCGGKITVEQACAQKGLDVLKVKEELADLDKSGGQKFDFNSWKPSFLADYIVNIHHGYIQQNVETLRGLSQKVADHHGKTNPELMIIRDKVDELLAELTAHMKKEERILFPYIKQLEENGGRVAGGFASVMQPISVMESDHDMAGELLRDIKAASHNYSAPENACNSYRFLYHKLSEFEDDLHLHIHLENNILFPKAIEMENAA